MESDYMLTVETKELEISKELKWRVEIICKFACVKPTFINWNIKSIKETSIAYVMPHIIKVNNIGASMIYTKSKKRISKKF